MKKYLGNYLGIVVSSASDDPENRNRVQVWIPHITNTLYDNWNENPADRNYFNNTYGTGLATVDQLQRLRQVLPWAECASPTFGGGTPYTENTASGRTSIDPYNTLEEPIGDTSLDISPEITTDGLSDEDIAAGVQIVDGVLVSLPEIPDTPENNAPGSGDDLPPVEPELPEFPTEDDTELQDAEGSSLLDEVQVPLETAEGEDYFPSTATRSDPSSTIEGQTPAELPPVGGGGRVIQRQQEVATSRKGALNESLVQTIQRGLNGTGLNWVSTSGTGAYGVANSEHRKGNATDGYFVYADGRSTDPLNPNNEEDRRILANAIYQLDRAGIGGVGWDGSAASGGTGNRYMGDDRFHLDIGGDNRNWGYTKRDNSAAEWIMDARDGSYDGSKLIASDLPSGELPANDQPIEIDDWGGANMASAVDGGHDGTSSGSFSSPDIGAKVWVFFHGGDIQKPVYFAQAIDSVSYGQTQQGIFYDNEQLNIA